MASLIKKKKVAIAGATGFVGRWFIERYKSKYDIIALSRRKVEGEDFDVQWREVDLFSISSSIKALQDVDYALYLVHSMQPSTRLNQASFEDTDLLLADNFSRAASECKVKQIVYLGGILPKDDKRLSKHLKSRYEVERVLGSRDTPLTTIRAGIIIGPGGSSFKIIKKLVQNLPVMACPKWTLSKNQPADLELALNAIDMLIGNDQFHHQFVEIGGREVITYMEILKITADVMGKKRWIFSVPFFSLGMSKLWVGLFSGSSTDFVSPLIESLKHEMTLNPSHRLNQKNSVSINDSITRALFQESTIPILPSFKANQSKPKNTVRSVQRISNPAKKSASWVAKQYPIWLSTNFRSLIKVENHENQLKFKLFGVSLLQLEYVDERSDKNRQLFYITGGFLTKRKDLGWLEFRSILQGAYIITAIHEFVPRLPWIIYRFTQAKSHSFVMKRFENYISKMHE